MTLKKLLKWKVKMFGLEYFLALMKIAFNVAFAIVGAWPTYYAWNCIAPIYLTMLPPVYLKLPYWHIVGIFIVCTFLGEQIQKLTPSIVKISQSNSNDQSNKK